MNQFHSMTARVEDYLTARRKLGFGLKAQGTQLFAFARFAERVGHRGPVTLELALRWARDSHSTRPITAAKRIGVLRPFVRYLQQFEPATEVPPFKLLGPTHRRPVPHIFSNAEVEELLAAAGRLPPAGGLQPATYETLFGLLAATGMRISEALRLERADVMLEAGMLNVSKSKCRRSRLVPLHETTIAALQRYAQFRDQLLPLAADDNFFLSPWGRALKLGTVEDTFCRLRRRLGWVARGDYPAPRIFDLRHAFITNCLLRWYQNQINVDNAIAALSTYVGHVRVSDTYWYVSAIPELMALAARRFERYAQETPND
ncbi:tyrosine-type recombinase/integrase [Cupriavidus necator]|uniref:tyrosine-type recombinase/integrase n=1 Tax=Cupriavidus necator TaxID=106590 RepID=UPI0005B53C5D|nr:tyrosine-type recombinase/integrase [Cupriavidus necator]